LGGLDFSLSQLFDSALLDGLTFFLGWLTVARLAI
jgi:hypothetical protein